MSEITPSSGNVFADIGVPDPDIALAKADLAIQIAAVIKKHHLTQQEARHRMGLGQANVSRLMNGELTGFTIDRLMRLLIRLDQQVVISVSESMAQPATLEVRAG